MFDNQNRKPLIIYLIIPIIGVFIGYIVKYIACKKKSIKTILITSCYFSLSAFIVISSMFLFSWLFSVRNLDLNSVGFLIVWVTFTGILLDTLFIEYVKRNFNLR
ncbi:MAG: hypothetical protein K9L64_06585 [Candidatus Izimaplasma sp.]|nr:hypothetical protein [Candidatus Izimaplasma bacterium]